MPKSSEQSPFPGRLKKARGLRGLSQSDLAQRSGLQPSAVSHFETGGRRPSFDNLLLLADVLQVTTDYLLGRTDTVAAAGPHANPFFADYAKLSATNQEVARTVVDSLVKKQASAAE